MAKITDSNFDAVNAQNVKLPVIILEIAGVPTIYASTQVFTNIRYDDPDVFYDGVFVYDGLRPLPPSGSNPVKNYIDRQGSNASISQKLEQWDGRASIETLSIKLIDKNSELTNLLTPGNVITDIINAKVKVWFGYQNLSYPDDYIRIFSGYINKYIAGQGYVVFNFTDPSSKRQQQIFNPATTTVKNNIDAGDSNIVLTSTSQLYKTITNAKGVTDSAVTIGIIIGDEIITFTNAAFNIDGFTLNGVTRGAFGTTPASHAIGDQVDNFLQISDNPITIALKVMLSGWNGPCFEDIGLRGIVNTDNGLTVADSITFNQGIDLKRDYGLAEGDFITLSGSSNPSNNDTFTIAQFFNDNRSVLVEETGILVQENPPVATVSAFRSQFDTLPETAGITLTTDEVDTNQHIYLRNTFIAFDFTMQIKASADSGKTWIEENLMKPIAGYSLTQGSRVSMGLTHPPLTTDFSKILNHTNVVDAKEIQVVRGVNERFFYNEIKFNYAYDLIQDTFFKQYVVEDVGAEQRMGQVSTLEIDVKGLPGDETSVQILSERAERLLLRYRYAAETVALKTTFGVGNTIDSGDIVVLSDKMTNGKQTPVLQISNTETGKRGIYNRVMEVQERSILLTEGKTKLNLLSNLGFSTTDRYAVIAPASLVDTGSSDTRFQIKESFGGRYPGQEYRKWQNYQGLKIRVHSPDFTRNAQAVFHLDSFNPFVFNLETSLGFTPQADDIVEFADYSDTSALDQQAVKSRYVSICNTGVVLSGSSSTVFTLQTGQGANYVTGNIVYVQSPNGTTRFSQEFKIISIVGDQITIGQIQTGVGDPNLGFTPQAGDFMKLGGFLDGGQSYRFV